MESTFTEIDWAQQIDDILFELKADTFHCGELGLTAEAVEGSEAVVKIYDKESVATCYADRLQAGLQSIDAIDLASADTVLDLVWDVIAEASVV